ncbi:MAG: Flp pilus assembly protein CpaB [Raoultibacter sp.]
MVSIIFYGKAQIVKKRSVLIGIICGLVCALAVFAYTQSVRSDADAARVEALARYGGEQADVCVATRDLIAGETLPLDAVATKAWLADLLPADAVRQADDVVGRQVSSSILAGEVISLKRFDQAASEIEVPAGLCAVSVPAKAVQSVGGSLCAGMKVNAYVTGGSSTDLILQDTLVLGTSAGQSSKKASSDMSWITLALPPDRMQEVIDASQKAELYFVLPATTDEGSK